MHKGYAKLHKNEREQVKDLLYLMCRYANMQMCEYECTGYKGGYI